MNKNKLKRWSTTLEIIGGIGIWLFMILGFIAVFAVSKTIAIISFCFLGLVLIVVIINTIIQKEILR